MNKPFMTEVPASVVDSSYATLAAAGPFALGDTVVCVRHGRLGVFVLSQNKSGGAFAIGDAVTAIDFATPTYEQDAVVYSTTNAARKGLASVKGDTDAVGSDGISADELAGDIMAITVGTGLGQFGLIVENEAAVASTDKLTSYLAKPFTTALAATDDYVILPVNKMRLATELAHLVYGVCPCTVADGAYFFRQVKGFCFAKITLSAAYGIDGTSDGLALSLSGSATDGALAVRDADGEDFDTQSHLVGYLIHKKGTADSGLGLVWLLGCIGSLA